MDLLSTGINALVVAVVGLLAAWYTKGRFDALDQRIDRVEERIDSRIDHLEARFDARFDRLESRFDAHVDRTG